MNACGVDLQPPRLPTRITRARGASVTMSAFGEIVDEQDIGGGERLRGAQGQQVQIAGACAQQSDFAFDGAHRCFLNLRACVNDAHRRGKRR